MQQIHQRVKLFRLSVVVLMKEKEGKKTLQSFSKCWYVLFIQFLIAFKFNFSIKKLKSYACAVVTIRIKIKVGFQNH